MKKIVLSLAVIGMMLTSCSDGTQVEVFQQEDFREGLNLCHSQFDLVEALPLYAHAMVLKRFEGKEEDPFKIEVKYLAEKNSVISNLLFDIDYKMSFDDGKEKWTNPSFKLGLRPLLRNFHNRYYAVYAERDKAGSWPNKDSYTNYYRGVLNL